jgi:hypothetical protein
VFTAVSFATPQYRGYVRGDLGHGTFVYGGIPE